jgi:hypothetical protein
MTHQSNRISALGLPLVVYFDDDANQVFDRPVVFSEITCAIAVLDQYSHLSSFDQPVFSQLRESLARLSGFSDIRLCEIGDYFITIRVSPSSPGGLDMTPCLEIAASFNSWIAKRLRGEKTDGRTAQSQPGDFFKSHNWLYFGIQ